MHPNKIPSLLLVIVVGLAAAARVGAAEEDSPKAGSKSVEIARMTLSSPAFADGQAIPTKYTSPGGAMSPPLEWSKVPRGTKSFVLHVHDLNTSRDPYRSVPTRVHWLLWNLPGSIMGLPEAVPSGSPRPDGTQQTSASGMGWLAPGLVEPDPRFPQTMLAHRYRFEIWALDTVLDIQPEPDAHKTRAKVMQAMQGHILGHGYLVGTF